MTITSFFDKNEKKGSTYINIPMGTLQHVNKIPEILTRCKLKKKNS